MPRPWGARQGLPSRGLRRSSRTFQAPPPPGLSQGIFLVQSPSRQTHPRPRVHLCTPKPPPGSRTTGPGGGPNSGTAHRLRGSAAPTAESSSNLPSSPCAFHVVSV